MAIANALQLEATRDL